MFKKIWVAGAFAICATGAFGNKIEECRRVNLDITDPFMSKKDDKYEAEMTEKLLSCAEREDSESLLIAGKLFWFGERVKKDQKKGVAYLAKAGSHGNWDAVVFMARINADFKNRPSTEYEKSIAAMRKSIELVDRCGTNGKYAYELAKLYDDHPNYISDYKKSVYYYRIAKTYFSIPPIKASERLEELKNEAPEVFEAEEKEFKNQLAKAKKGNLEAMYRVGFAYEKGYGVDENIVEAGNWYKKSMKYQLSAVRWADISMRSEFHPHSEKISKLEDEAGRAKYKGEKEKESLINKELEPLKSENSKSRAKTKIQVMKIYKDAADRLNDTDSMINYWTHVDDRNNNTEYLEKAASAENMLAQQILEKVNDYNKKLKDGKPAGMFACGAVIKNPFYDVY